jgi:hypothetical protein
MRIGLLQRGREVSATSSEIKRRPINERVELKGAHFSVWKRPGAILKETLLPVPLPAGAGRGYGKLGCHRPDPLLDRFVEEREKSKLHENLDAPN